MEQKGDKLKHGYKSSDSEGGDKSDDNLDKADPCKDNESSSDKQSSGKDSRNVQFFGEEKEQKLDNIAESSEIVDENNMKKSDVGK